MFFEAREPIQMKFEAIELMGLAVREKRTRHTNVLGTDMAHKQQVCSVKRPLEKIMSLAIQKRLSGYTMFSWRRQSYTDEIWTPKMI